jgi:hypothetical protein
MASQLLITTQTKALSTWFLNLPLDEYIDNTETQSLNFESKDTRRTARRPKAKKSSRRSSRRRKHHKASKKQEKRQTKEKWERGAKKSSKSQISHNSP